MNDHLVRYFDGRKFMWDGREYGSNRESREMAYAYREQGFEVQTVKEGNIFLVYTRRVVTDIQIDG